MKILSFIFSIYFFSLAMLPCCDNGCCSQDSITTTAYVQTNHCQDTQHTAELCSPLCTCHCCGGVTIVSNSGNNLIAPIPTGQLSIYTQKSPSEIFFSIWQPPKV